jgi:hypothetical protein
LREEHRLRVLRKTCGPKRDEAGKWRRLHNEDHYNLYSSPNIIRVITWAGHVTRMGDRRGACRILVGGLEGKKQLGRPRRRWEDNIKMDFQEMGWEAWTGLT